MEMAYISAAEAAQILSKTRRRINQLVASGKLAGKLVGNSNVISRAAVLKLLKADAKRNGGNKVKGKR